ISSGGRSPVKEICVGPILFNLGTILCTPSRTDKGTCPASPAPANRHGPRTSHRSDRHTAKDAQRPAKKESFHPATKRWAIVPWFWVWAYGRYCLAQHSQRNSRQWVLGHVCHECRPAEIPPQLAQSDRKGQLCSGRSLGQPSINSLHHYLTQNALCHARQRIL